MNEEFSVIWNWLEQQDLAKARSELQQLPEPAAEQEIALRHLLLAELLRREGDNSGADGQFRLACQLITNSGWLAVACHCNGLNLRSMGKFVEAAEAFLNALEVQPGHVASVHALQFTKLSTENIKALLGRLSSVVKPARQFPLGLQLLADWEFQIGQRHQALEHSYYSAQLSVSAQQKQLLNWGAIPSLPEALIIGAPKSGTTSLAAALSTHPQLWMHPRKELHFLDGRWEWGQSWYRCQFPVFQAAAQIIRLEATPNYLQLPEAPERLHGLMPAARLVVLLREPLDRAVSWYHHMTRQEGLTKPLEEVIETELNGLLELSKQEHSQLGWYGSNCLAGSFYGAQLERWQRFFKPEQLLVLRFEDIVLNPLLASQKVALHLGVDPDLLCPKLALAKLNAAPATYLALNPGLAERCRETLLGADCDLWRGLS